MQTYSTFRALLLSLLVLDGLLATVWIVLLVSKYDGVWSSFMDGFYSRESIGDVLTLGYCRFFGFVLVVWFDNGKWLLIGFIRHFMVLVVVCSTLWIPLKAALFFDINHFVGVEGSDARWVAIVVMVLGALVPLAQGALLKFTCYDGRLYLLEATDSLRFSLLEGQSVVIEDIEDNEALADEQTALLGGQSLLDL